MVAKDLQEYENNKSCIIFAYSESKLTCHFVLVVVLVLGGKMSKILLY